MEASKVYYTDFRCPVGTSLLDKLRRVCIAAGIKDIDMDGKFVAIKMHFGELGNLAFLRPNYAKVVADLCKEQGGLPFLTDCNTLYPGSRKNALEHLTCAQLNGFWPMTTGCQVIIADGLRGTDEAEVPVPNGEYCKTAKIGRAIMDADIFISLTHFKGHESTGFGGTLKNIGMGCGSRAGKMIQHAAGHPEVQQSLCRGCHRCAKECGSDAITYDANNKAVIDQTKCKGCGRCIGACNFDAIYSQCDSANEMLDRKMAEYAAAVCAGRPCFHVSLVQDISPNCDCHCENDAPILPDIGIFASFDPVALDQACADACLNAQPLPNSQLGQNLAKPGWNCHHDNFKDSNPNIEWKATLEQAEKIGMGTRQYVLAEESDVIVAVVGGSSSRFGGAVFDANGAASKGTGSRSMDCGEGMDTAKVHIPAAQEELIAALARLGKPLVTVVIAGRAYCIEKIENASDAVLYAFYPGPMGGRAVAELLYGSSNPSGRLPVSMPRHVGQIPVCYNYRTSVAPAYCDMTSQPLHTFGEGRSYTTFTGSDVSVTKEENGISVSFTVENTGNMAGTSVPCLYVRKRSGGVVARIKELKAFTRIALAPGEKKEAVFHLTKEELNFVQIPGKPEVICHEYELMLEDGAEKWWTGNVTEM